MFCKKGVLKNFVKFTGKHLSQSAFLIMKQAATCNFIKKRLWPRWFPVSFSKFSRKCMFIEHVRWLLLVLFFLFAHKEWKNVCFDTEFIEFADFYTAVLFWKYLNPIQDSGWGEGVGQKVLPLPTSFSPVTSTNVGTSSQNFLTFTFNPFATLLSISRLYLEPVPNYWTWTKISSQKIWFF